MNRVIQQVGLYAVFVALAATRGAADVNVPPGYRVVELSTDPESYNRWTRINDRGQVVWAAGFDAYDSSTYEIMLYDRGIVTRLTNDSKCDAFPDINNDGTVVWSRGVGPGGALEIAMYRDGVISYLTDESGESAPQGNYTPVINDLGHVAWFRLARGGCGNVDSEVWFFDGMTSRQISNIGLSSQAIAINNQDSIAWLVYDFCTNFHRPARFVNRRIEFLGNLEYSANGPVAIREDNSVLWTGEDVSEYNRGILHSDGKTTSVVTEWGIGPSVSLDNRVSFFRWFEAAQTYQVMYYRDGILEQLTNDAFSNSVPSIDIEGEIAWQSGDWPNLQIRALLRQPTGDLNCDSLLSVSDIPPFVLALVAADTYADQFPDCDRSLADTNADGYVGMADIGGFVRLLMP